jgi:hypothetical protein
MSLVATWARAQDGYYYKNPVLRGPDWFLCFDDDDPPELVIAVPVSTKKIRGTSRDMAARILADAGITYRNMRVNGTAFRVFSKEIGDLSGMREAYSVFIDILAPIPIPQEHDGKSTLKEARKRECALVLYTFPQSK